MKKLLWSVVMVLCLIWVGAAFAADGAKIYTEKCSACHALNGTGSPMGPALKGNEFITKGNAADITKVIVEGRMGKDKKYPKFPIDMPKNPMAEADVDALVKYIQGGLQK